MYVFDNIGFWETVIKAYACNCCLRLRLRLYHNWLNKYKARAVSTYTPVDFTLNKANVVRKLLLDKSGCAVLPLVEVSNVDCMIRSLCTD